MKRSAREILDAIETRKGHVESDFIKQIIAAMNNGTLLNPDQAEFLAKFVRDCLSQQKTYKDTTKYAAIIATWINSCK